MHDYSTEQQSFEYGSWHTFRIEIEPATMTITYYIDGQMVGSHVPVDAEQLKKANFSLDIGIWAPSAGALTGSVDDVRIGPLGQ